MQINWAYGGGRVGGQWERMFLPMQEMQETPVWSLGWEKSQVENDNTLQYSFLENPMDMGI